MFLSSALDLSLSSTRREGYSEVFIDKLYEDSCENLDWKRDKK